MLMLDRVRRELEGLGAKVDSRLMPGAASGDTVLSVRVGGASAIFVIEAKARAPYPSEVVRLDHAKTRLSKVGVPMLVAQYISAGEGDALVARGWSWADGQGNFDLRSGTIRLRQRISRSGPAHPRKALPRGAGGLAVIRALIARPLYRGPRLTQAGLAKLLGITQARVAQVMARLREEQLIESADGASDAERARLLDAFLQHYEGPGGNEAYFYSLDSLREVAKRFDARRAGRWAISADVGPDLIAPHRAPTILVLYSGGFERVPQAAGLVAAEGRGDANVIVRAPRDTSAFGPDALPLMRRVDRTSIRLADPTQLIWDLRQLGGEDRLASADKVRKWLLDR